MNTQDSVHSWYILPVLCSVTCSLSKFSSTLPILPYKEGFLVTFSLCKYSYRYTGITPDYHTPQVKGNQVNIVGNIGCLGHLDYWNMGLTNQIVVYSICYIFVTLQECQEIIGKFIRPPFIHSVCVIVW